MALRNVIHRRNHKERSQPTHRTKFGLLEKHKDYVQRARDHNVKKQRIHKLTQKASLRNPDEFNFGMIRSASNDLTKGGVHVERRRGGDSEPLDNDLVAILKSQDLNYVRGAIRAEEKKMEEIRQFIRPQLAFVTNDWLENKEGREDVLINQGLLAANRAKVAGDQPIGMQGKKTIWVDDIDQARSYKPSKGKGKQATTSKQYSLDMDDDDDELDDDLEEGKTTSGSKSAEKRLGFMISQLSARQNRLDTLNDARSKLEVVRALMTTKGTSARKVQAKSDAIKAAVVNGKVTANGLSVQATSDDDDEEEEESLGDKKKKRMTWKWGRERTK